MECVRPTTLSLSFDQDNNLILEIRRGVKKPAGAGYVTCDVHDRCAINFSAICALYSYGFTYKEIADIAITAIETMILHFVSIYSPSAFWRAASPFIFYLALSWVIGGLLLGVRIFTILRPKLCPDLPRCVRCCAACPNQKVQRGKF